MDQCKRWYDARTPPLHDTGYPAVDTPRDIESVRPWSHPRSLSSTKSWTTFNPATQVANAVTVRYQPPHQKLLFTNSNMQKSRIVPTPPHWLSSRERNSFFALSHPRDQQQAPTPAERQSNSQKTKREEKGGKETRRDAGQEGE